MERVKIIACKVIENELMTLLSENQEALFLEYALHRTPHRLQEELQKTIDAQSDCDTILLCYGLCSNGTCGLSSKDKKLVIPRVHDCISLLLGSRERYSEEFDRHPGTIYLSKGWIDCGADPYSSLKEYTKKYGEETAQWIIHEEYKNYERLVFIKTQVGDLKKYREYAQMVAESIHLKYVEIEGSLALLRQLLKGDWDESLVIPPGKMIIEHMFR